MHNSFPYQQRAYHQGRISFSHDVDRDIYEAMRRYLVQDFGIRDHIARKRADRELQRQIPIAVLDSLSAAGIRITNADVLDLGAGLGGLSEELVLRGARVIALEPGAAWGDLAKRRVERCRGKFHLVKALGESIPLPAASVDLVISLQVLEHVSEPDNVLAEVWRILRPGGYFYLACENYLAFREAHYQVPWFPLLPKLVGGFYLRLLGRSPRFLFEAVTYTTYPGVLRQCWRLGFIRRRDDEIIAALRSKSGMKWKLLRTVAFVIGNRAPLWFDLARSAFRFGIYELFRKPVPARHTS